LVFVSIDESISPSHFVFRRYILSSGRKKLTSSKGYNCIMSNKIIIGLIYTKLKITITFDCQWRSDDSNFMPVNLLYLLIRWHNFISWDEQHMWNVSIATFVGHHVLTGFYSNGKDSCTNYSQIQLLQWKESFLN
jgi:hypothetical protein